MSDDKDLIATIKWQAREIDSFNTRLEAAFRVSRANRAEADRLKRELAEAKSKLQQESRDKEIIQWQASQIDELRGRIEALQKKTEANDPVQFEYQIERADGEWIGVQARDGKTILSVTHTKGGDQ